MTRKESEKDTERPHYYSQFWLDVAAGRRVIGSSKTTEESETGERGERDSQESGAARKPARGSHIPSSESREREEPRASQAETLTAQAHQSEVTAPAASSAAASSEETIAPEEELPTVEEDEESVEADEEDEELLEEEPLDTPPEEEEYAEEEELEPDFEEEEEEEDEEFFDEEEEEEDEDLWPGGKGKKKQPKPGRQSKPAKRPKRETRRGY
ncbi:hypothetical protein [Thermogemmatispora carboxidivorans]|uniref:hypothetical protein n=1 Tax=Thermogemmatispora carboxidivorans TaxID=1382306 RepID=UPI00069C7BC5|nr:hypothetical protein [Thermogemmatispora carboxidivorans]